MRQIIFDNRCDDAVEHLGGFKRIDASWLAIAEALTRNPFGFDGVETDWFHFARYAISEAIGDCPALVWVFEIDEDKNVVVIDVQEYEPI